MRAFAIYLVLTLLSEPAVGQAPQGVTRGERVWVRSLNSAGRWGRGVKGTVVSVESDGLRIRTAGRDSITIPLTPGTKVLVSVGKRSSAARGLGLGLGIGVGTGALLGYAGGEDCSTSGSWICFDRGTTALIGAVGLGAIGMFLGLCVGAAIPHEAWRTTTSRVAFQPMVKPIGDRWGAGIRLSF